MATEHLIKPSPSECEALRGEVYWGIVSAVVDGAVVVSHDGRATYAHCAASCLLAPQAGDRVLLARVESNVFVLAVLERESNDREISVEGELRVRAGGTVRVDAGEDLRLRSKGTASIATQTLTFAARRASWVSERLRVLSSHLSLESDHVRQVASFSEAVIESMKETLGRSYREIRESEHVSAGSLALSLRGLLRAHADTAIVTAKKLVKLDADQVHLG